MPDNDKICSRCNNFALDNTILQNINDEFYCKTCIDELFVACDKCGNLIKRDSAKCFDDAIFCTTCFDRDYTECANCDETIARCEAVLVFNRPYCEDCANDSFFQCVSCGETFNNNDRCNDDNDDCSYCSACYDRDYSHNDIHNHDYIPSPQFHKTLDDKKEVTYFGFELECGTNDEASYHLAIKNLPELFYLKEDGSIFDADIHYGFEVVSHPFSWNWLQENKNIIKNYCNFLIKNSFISYKLKSCGLHVHISKKYITSLKIYKMLAFIYDIKNAPFLLAISGRTPEKLRQWASIDSDMCIKRNAKILKLAKAKYQPFRYTAINLNPDHTIEFRIFRGTLVFESILRCFEFVKAIVDFTEDTFVRDINLSSFTDFVAKNSKNYPHLDKWLVIHKWRA